MSFTVQDAQKLERELHKRHCEAAVTILKPQIIEKLESWVLTSETKSCAFELPPRDTDSIIATELIMDDLVSFLRELGFEIYDISLNLGSFVIGWGHLSPTMLTERREGFCAITLRQKQISKQKQKDTNILAKLLEQCNQTIQDRIKGGQSAGFCFFPIPSIYKEVSLDTVWFRQKLKEDLTKRGFIVSEESSLSDNLHISWDLQEITRTVPIPETKTETTETKTCGIEDMEQTLKHYTNEAITAYLLSLQFQKMSRQKVVDVSEQKRLGERLRSVMDTVNKYKAKLLRTSVRETDIVPLAQSEK